MAILEGLIPAEDNEHKDMSYERPPAQTGPPLTHRTDPDAGQPPDPELALDLKGVICSFHVIEVHSFIKWCFRSIDGRDDGGGKNRSFAQVVSEPPGTPLRLCCCLVCWRILGKGGSTPI